MSWTTAEEKEARRLDDRLNQAELRVRIPARLLAEARRCVRDEDADMTWLVTFALDRLIADLDESREDAKANGTF